MMRVELITHTPEPEKVVATAAKLCYSSSDIASLREGLTEEKTKSFIERLVSIGHESPMEHVSFTFGIEGISRACSHQLVRHRIASYSQKSQRYVNESGFEDQLLECYNKIADILTNTHEKAFLEQGMSEKDALNKAKKKAYEDARFVLPNACETKIVVTMNVRTLFNFFQHRCCNRAQWEIKAVADEMLRLCKQAAPELFKNVGPSCVMKGKCPEGAMSCGKMAEVKKIYGEMNNVE